MLPERPFQDGGEEDETGSKRFNEHANDILNNFPMDAFFQKIETKLQAMMLETAEKAFGSTLQQMPRSLSFNQPKSSRSSGFRLHFIDNQVPSTIYTNNKIKTKDGNPIQVKLLDANTNSIVMSGPLSSMKLVIVVLDGDFGSDDSEDWSESEFVAKIIRERYGKRPLLIGELTITLKNGVGKIGDVSFSDNSSWIRCRKFRLGIQPMQKTYGNTRVREVKSDAFVVRDQRGEAYKKHYPPHQNDDIWRLEKISKNGKYHKRLASKGIHKVKDFMQFHAIDPSELRKMFEGISDKNWDTILRHIATCVIDNDELYIYHVPGQNIVLFFNSIYKLIIATFDGQNYEQIDKLSANHKALIEYWKGQAYKNTNNFKQTSARDIFGPSRPSTIMPLNDADNEMQQRALLTPCQDKLYMPPGMDNALSSALNSLQVETNNNIMNQAFPTSTKAINGAIRTWQCLLPQVILHL